MSIIADPSVATAEAKEDKEEHARQRQQDHARNLQTLETNLLGSINTLYCAADSMDSGKDHQAFEQHMFVRTEKKKSPHPCTRTQKNTEKICWKNFNNLVMLPRNSTIFSSQSVFSSLAFFSFEKDDAIVNGIVEQENRLGIQRGFAHERILPVDREPQQSLSSASHQRQRM